MKLQLKYQNAISLLLLADLSLNLAVSGISNASFTSNIIKILCSTVLLAFTLIHSKLTGINLISVVKSTGLKKIITVLTLIILYLFLTLTYSSNRLYGLQKILNIIISIAPEIVVLYYLIFYSDLTKLKSNLVIITLTGFTSVFLIILISNPFDHSTIYQYAPGRWSHVFVGRIAAFLTLIIFFFFLTAKENKKILLYAYIFLAGFLITYITGLRSALIGLTICCSISFFWFVVKRYLSPFQLINAVVILIISFTIIYFTLDKTPTGGRLENITLIENMEFGGDAPILTRISSYKLSWQMFKESPLIGYGFGGFNGYNNIKWTTIQKYPHNIILEILSELGIIGFLLFLILCYSLIKKIFNLSFFKQNNTSPLNPHPSSLTHHPPVPMGSSIIHFILLTFFFSIFLAMWSKDISTQSFLWLFLVLLGAFSWSHSDKSFNDPQ